MGFSSYEPKSKLDLVTGIVALFAAIISSVIILTRLPFGPSAGFMLRESTVILLFWTIIALIILTLVVGGGLIVEMYIKARRGARIYSDVSDNTQDRQYPEGENQPPKG